MTKFVGNRSKSVGSSSYPRARSAGAPGTGGLTRWPTRTAILLLGATTLSGCLGAGSGSIAYDPAVRNAAGTITLGDPKLYSREALINERAADIAWIDKLIADSEDPAKVSFKPALIREMEEISAFSAALGVRYDPAAGVSYRRSSETGEIQQEIDVLKAKVALAQLKRDIELVEAKFPAQTDPVNTGLGTVGTGGALPAANAVTPPDATQVAATVNALITSVTARLDAEGKPIGKTEVVSSPADDFQDRLAYRNMLKAARNAAALDELHDAGDNRLVRLNLQATVLPDRQNARALGAVQVKVSDTPDGSSTRFLEGWLRSINGRSEWRIDAATFSPNVTLDALETSGDFEEVRLGKVLLLMPVLRAGTATTLPSDLLLSGKWTRPAQADTAYFGGMLATLSVDGAAREAVLKGLCRPNSPLSLALSTASARHRSLGLVRLANLIATDLGVPLPVSDALTLQNNAENYQDIVLGMIKDRPDCADLTAQYSPTEPTWRLLRRPEFSGTQQVRIYEVGPKEQAQQVSTVARSASSLALAVSVAASAPGAGVAGNLGAGYQREVMNRASALDRVPEVIGYSVGGQRTFGWVIGPHATTDTRGRAMVEQVTKSYDLSVDLSVPSWWSAMGLEITSVWAPSPRQLTEGSLAAVRTKNNPQSVPVKVAVPLPSVHADYRLFTKFLTGDTTKLVRIDSVTGGPVTGCAPTTLYIKGENLWRADTVLLLGMSLGHDKFVIAPDMAGIIVTVPAVAAIPGDRAYRQDGQVRVLTSVGDDQAAFVYDSSLSGDSCKAKAADAAEDTTSVTVSAAAQTSFVIPSLVRIDVTGTSLSKVDEVRLDGRKGSITGRAGDGKSFTAEFSRDITEGIEPGNVKLEFFTAKKSVGTAQTIRLVRH